MQLRIASSYGSIVFLRDARDELVIADPDVSGGYELDASCRFLVLMSAGVWRSLALGTTQGINGEIVGMVAAEFSVQTTLNGVAEAVVDRIA